MSSRVCRNGTIPALYSFTAASAFCATVGVAALRQIVSIRRIFGSSLPVAIILARRMTFSQEPPKVRCFRSTLFTSCASEDLMASADAGLSVVNDM